jgi:hypothetical protein
MAIQVSTGLRSGMMNASGAKELLDGGTIKVLSGAVPADADAAQTGTVLWTISVNGAGTGLTWEMNGAEIRKPSASAWQGATTAGTGTYFRVVGSADTGALSTTQARIQGTFGTSATNDFVASNATFTTDASTSARVLGAASFVLPTL